jgi:hypothetical protein
VSADRRAAALRVAKARLIEAGLGAAPWFGVPFIHPDGRADMLTSITVSAADIDALLESEREAALGDTTAPYGTVVVDDPDAGGAL